MNIDDEGRWLEREAVVMFYLKSFLKYSETDFSFLGAAAPVAKAQSLIVESCPADTICFPSGENAAAQTAPE